MGMTQWYELRIVGSAGTRAGVGAEIKEGIAVGEDGRLCPVSSGKAMKFKSESDAEYHLNTATSPGIYKFEVVLCRDAAPVNPPSSTRASR